MKMLAKVNGETVSVKVTVGGSEQWNGENENDPNNVSVAAAGAAATTMNTTTSATCTNMEEKKEDVVVVMKNPLTMKMTSTTTTATAAPTTTTMTRSMTEEARTTNTAKASAPQDLTSLVDPPTVTTTTSRKKGTATHDTVSQDGASAQRQQTNENPKGPTTATATVTVTVTSKVAATATSSSTSGDGNFKDENDSMRNSGSGNNNSNSSSNTVTMEKKDNNKPNSSQRNNNNNVTTQSSQKVKNDSSTATSSSAAAAAGLKRKNSSTNLSSPHKNRQSRQSQQSQQQPDYLAGSTTTLTRSSRRSFNNANERGNENRSYTSLYQQSSHIHSNIILQQSIPLPSPIQEEDIEILADLDPCVKYITTLQDISFLHKNLLFPTSFPWYNPPQHLSPTMPRDIDDHPGILFADHDYDETLPPSVTDGKRGFRRILHWEHHVTPCGYPYQTAIRRSEDPGVMDLHYRMVLKKEHDCSYLNNDDHDHDYDYDSNFDHNYDAHDVVSASRRDNYDNNNHHDTTTSDVPSPRSVFLWNQKKKRMSEDGDRAEFASTMPWHWSSRYDFSSPFQYKKSEADDWDMTDLCSSNGDSSHDHREEENKTYVKILQQEKNERYQKQREKFWYRNWKVSVKVGGVSSRASIIHNAKTDNEATPSTSNHSKSKKEKQNNASNSNNSLKSSFKRERELSSSSLSQLSSSHEISRKRRRPRLTSAYYPAFVQSGRSVLATTAITMDKNGFGSFLGSYDCRFASSTPSSNPIHEKNGMTSRNNQPNSSSSLDKNPPTSTRAKRVLVGRTRLIWTHLDVTPPSYDGNVEIVSKKNVYTSLLKGSKLDASAYKRPREVKVAIRLNGERILEDEPSSKSKQSKNAEDGDKKLRLRISMKNIKSNTTNIKTEPEEDKDSLTKEEEHSHENLNNAYNALCTYDRKDLLNILRHSGKSNAKKKASQQHTSHSRHQSPESKQITQASQFMPMKYGATAALKHKPPVFSLLPLDDGSLRVVCQTTGSMNGAGIHAILNQASRKYNGERVCSICWTGATKYIGRSGLLKENILQECVDCGLLVHLDCCADKGQIWYGEEPGGQNQTASLQTRENENEDNTSINGNDNGDSISKSGPMSWRCPVCLHYRNKSNPANNATVGSSGDENAISVSTEVPVRKKLRRASKIPSRYLSESSAYSHQNINASKKLRKPNHKYRPSWKCTLCPHSGGAMAPVLVDDQNCDDQTKCFPSKWTHDVCRIWCGSTVRKSRMSGLPNVCALCNSGNTNCKDTKSTSVSPNDQGHDPHPSPNSQNCETEKFNTSGLVKCAARGCLVTFHPFCAMLVSKLKAEEIGTDMNAEHEKEVTALHQEIFGDNVMALMNEELKRDASLSKQYTLQILKVSRTEGAYGSVPGKKKTSVIPIAFCGLHNPNRDPSLFGCLPEGEVISSVMRIPAIQEIEKE